MREMLAPDAPAHALDAIIFVLFEPQDVVNIGGVARAMSNFGLRRLRLVEPAEYDPDRVRGIAHQADAVIAGITVFPTLPAALADCGLVVATTGRRRRLHHARQSPRAAASVLLAAARPEAPVAVLFGREDTGLPNSALDEAHRVITIPTDPAHHSLNLAQAALVVAYELWLARAAGAARPDASPGPAARAARATLLGALDTLVQTHRAFPPDRRAADLALLWTLLLRAMPDRAEAARLAYLLRRLARPAGDEDAPRP